MRTEITRRQTNTEKATDLPVSQYELAPGDHLPVLLCRMKQRNGSELWAIRHGNDTFNHDAEWEYEPTPSSRDDDYMARNRYASAQAALDWWNQCHK